MPHPEAVHQPDYEPDRRIETAADQGIYNAYMANSAEKGYWPPAEDSGKPEAHVAPRRHTWRGSFNEGSDSEHDPNWNVPVPPLTDEQKEINLQGVVKARRALAEHHAKRLAERAGNDSRSAMALSRLDAERRQRNPELYN